MDFKEYERQMQNPKYKELKVTTCKDNQDYVFISYSSKSWEKVLTEIVYRLQKEYHLRIYFDKDFASKPEAWLKQFQDNMEHPNCKAFICFFDEGYVTSYATMLELMHAMNKKSGLKDQIYSVNFNINWEALESANDTGLGKASPTNPNARDEKKYFDKEYQLLLKNSDYEEIANEIVFYYDPDLNRPLTISACKTIMGILQPKNQRMYSPTEDFFEHFIVDPLKKAGLDVFDEVPEESKIIQQADPAPTETMPSLSANAAEESAIKGSEAARSIASISPAQNTETPRHEEQTRSITLIDFLKKYNNSTFKKSTYAKFRLVGSNGNERYTTEYSDSAFDLVWNFVMSLIQEKGMDYINAVNEKHSGLKNPVFISQEEYEKRNDQLKYRRIDVDGLNSYYMYRHYGQFQWIDTVLKPRLMEFGLRLEDFSFEFIIGDEGPETNVQNPVQVCAMPVEQSDATANAVPSQTVEPQKNSLADVFTYSLWGEQHTAKTLSGMMHDVFDLIAEKYASDIPAMAHDNRISALALMQDVDEQKLPPNKLSYFRVKKAHSVDGEQYYVGTSYNRQQGIAQLKKMLEICEGSADGLNIFSSPQKSAHENKGGKKGIGEIL